MPNDALLAAVEQLRDTYSQRQKVTNGLLATLKGVTGTLGKASRMLRDYGEQHPAALPDGVAQAQQALTNYRLKDEVVDPLVPDLKREAKALGTQLAALKDAAVALRGDVVDVVRLGRAFGVLRSAKTQDDELTSLLSQLEAELAQAQQELGVTFGQALRDAVKALGFDLGGRPPHFEIERFAIEANFVQRTATISYGKEVVAGRVPLSVEAVIGAYQRETKAITRRNEDGGRWIEQFYTAWDSARRKRERADQRANIVECYYEQVMLRQSKAFRSAPSKRTFADYSRAQFAYDFFEFTNQQRLAYKDLRVFAHSATKSHTDNVDKSFWIVEGAGPNDGRYIADVVFAKDE